jgi:hypothetical protein
MQDKTIDNALIALRHQIVCEGREGLEQVEALLALRGVRLPRVICNMPKRGAMRLHVVAALRRGPMTRREMLEHMANVRPDVPLNKLYWRVDSALSKLRMMAMAKRAECDGFAR